MRRNRLLIFLTVTATALSGTFLFTSAGVGADTATPEYTTEGWFARNRYPAPQVDVPCDITTLTTTRPQCGPTSPANPSAPQSPETGAYVVASSGGQWGDAEPSGDTGWAAFQWDLYSFLKADVTKFQLTLTQVPRPSQQTPPDQTYSPRGDTYDPASSPPPAIIACNILAYWGAQPGSNPWETKPKLDKLCVAPTVNPANKSKFTFDLTALAQTWVDGTGYGVAIVPGLVKANEVVTTSDAENDVIQPFQITFAGYETKHPNPANYIPQVAFEFTPAPEDDLFGGGGGGDGGGGSDFFEEITTVDGSAGGELQALPDLDIIPTDVGSEPVAGDAAPPAEDIGEVAAPPTRRAAADTSFPLLAFLAILLLAVLAFWGTGTALGSVGDPVPARVGGVSRVLAQRHIANGRSDSTRGL